MLLTWLNRLFFVALVAAGVLVSFENREVISFTVGGLTYSAKAYVILLGAVILGFVLGVFLTTLDHKAKQVRKFITEKTTKQTPPTK